MFRIASSTALALALAAAPAFAQSSGGEEGMDKESRAAAETGSAGAMNGGETAAGEKAAGEKGTGERQAAAREGEGMSAEQMALSQRRVISALNEAGFSDVEIMDAAYLVSATTDSREQVMMVVNSAGEPVRTGQARTTR